MRYDVITDTTAKGLTVDVYRNAHRDYDCTAQGASARFTQFTIIEVVRDGVAEPMPKSSRAHQVSATTPAARLVYRSMMGGLWHLEPVVDAPTQPWLMHGGNLADVTDSRLSDLIGLSRGPLHIHDRKEF